MSSDTPGPALVRAYRASQRLYLLILLAIFVAGAFFAHGALRWIGVGGVGVCVLGLVSTYIYVSQRLTGWLAVAFGLALSAYATFAPPDELSAPFAALGEKYHLSANDLALVVGDWFQNGAGALFALGASLIFLDRAERTIPDGARRLAGTVGVLVAVAYGILVFAVPDFQRIGLQTFVALTVVGAAADITTPRRQWVVAGAITLVGIMIAANVLYPGWREPFLAQVGRRLEFVARNTHGFMAWPVLIAGFVTTLQCINGRVPWRAAIFRVFSLMVVIWMVLVYVAGSSPEATRP